MTKELQEILKGKTVIYCAHRLSSVKAVDKIHVLQDGKVQEEGTHNELMEGKALIPYPGPEVTDVASGGKIYQRMWQNFMSERRQGTMKEEAEDVGPLGHSHEHSHSHTEDTVRGCGGGCGGH